MIAYEIYKRFSISEIKSGISNQEPLADSEELEGYFSHLQQVLITTDFLDPENPRQMMKRLRRLYQRAEPSKKEINILRGTLTAVEKFRKT